MEGKFVKKDSENLVELLNLVAKKAVFNGLSIQELLQIARLLNWSQTSLLPKIDSNLFEIEKIELVNKKPKGSK